MSTIFHFFIKWWPLNNYKKCFLFHLKSFFRSRDIQVLVFPPSLLFFSVSHSLRGWSKINLKVYDINNYLNKNLITHFVCYLEKEKRHDIETLSIDRARKEYFMQKSWRKCTPFLVLVNKPKQPLHARDCCH